MFQVHRAGLLRLMAALVVAVVAPSAPAEEPWRLQQAADLPDWLLVEGAARLRYETLDGQFRRFLDGGDQALLWRGNLFVRALTEVGEFGFELHDTRAWYMDTGSPISTSFVNTGAILQAYYRGRFDLWGSTPNRTWLAVGRYTLDIGSRRFVERNGFRNTVNNYTGLHWHAEWTSVGILDAFYTVPVRRFPRDRDGLLDNEYARDEEEWGRRWWGVHWQQRPLRPRLQADVFVYGLHESDRADRPTFDRNVWAPGFRLVRRPQPIDWDFEFETAWRTGTLSRSLLPGADTLDVNAWMVHAEVGYTFDASWNLRIGLEYDLATGDGDPDDDSFERYERFFGTRRADLGNTSIHGPLTRSNVSVPGIRVSFDRGRWDGRAYVERAYLDEARDFWFVAGLRDPTGRSGRDIGTTFDGRIRYWLYPGNLRLEVGFSALWFGDFTEQVPDGPDGSRTLYGYLQATAYF